MFDVRNRHIRILWMYILISCADNFKIVLIFPTFFVIYPLLRKLQRKYKNNFPNAPTIFKILHESFYKVFDWNMISD